MTVPPRWTSDEAGAPDAVRQLLAAAPRPRKLHAHEHAALARHAVHLSSGASVGFGGIALAKFLAVGVVVASAGAVVHWRTSHPHHVVSPRSVIHRPVEARARPAVPAPTLVPAISTTVSHIAPVLPPTAVERHATSAPVGHAYAVPRGPDLQPTPTPVGVAPVLQSPELPLAVGAPHGPTLPQAPMSDLALLLAARRHLGADDTRALTLLRQHESLYAGSQLAPERDFMMIEALLALGRVEEAQQAGSSLVARDPGGPFARRARRLLGAVRIPSSTVDSPMQSPPTPQ